MKIVVCAGFSGSLINFRGPLLRALKAAGHEVVAWGPEDDENVRRRLAEWGIPFQSVPLQRTSLNPWRDLRSLFALRQALIQAKAEVFLGYTIKPVIYGALAARWAGIPRIFALITGLGYSFMGLNWKQRLVGSLTRPLYALALRQCRHTFFQNGDDRQLFIELGLLKPSASSSVVHGSGVDLGYYSYTPPPSQESGFTFLLIARLIGEKGIYEYVEAAKKVKAKNPQARFQLMGSMENRPGAICQAELERWQREGVIEYLGEQSDVRPFLARCHAYVLPSYREGTPRTVLEAMAMGRPVITTDVPGCRQTIEPHRNGFLVPPRDARALGEAMERFLRDPELSRQMGEESLALVSEKFDVHRVNAAMLQGMRLAPSA